MDDFGRKTLSHDTPPWVDPAASDYFITICCQRRGTNQLCTSAAASGLLDCARFYYSKQKWFPSLFLLMPDHLYMLAGFGRAQEMTKVVAAWKRYTATHFGTVWQQGFFEHRLRTSESVAEKSMYILLNPERAGLVKEASDWPHVLRLP